jgi:glycosyltransferase involved in cell wall biosynthesis
VSDYALELLGALASRASIRVAKPPGWNESGGWPDTLGLELVSTETRADPDEVTLLHLGNNPHHLWLLDRLGRPRTVMVLHDLVLHHLLVEAGRAATTSEFAAAALRETYGAAGTALAAAREVGYTGRRDPFLFPAVEPFIAGAAAVIVHSSWGRDRIRREMPHLPVGLLGLPAADPGPVDRMAVRGRLGLDERDVIVMHLGFLTPEKGLQSLVGGVAAAAAAGVPVRLVLVGEGSAGEEVRCAAEAAGIEDRLCATGWIQAEEFLSIPAAADLGVVLRTPSAGETSAAVVRFLACGTPVAVGGRHQFLEFPESAAPRLTPGPSASADLARVLESVARGGQEWTHRRTAAREAYEADHTPKGAADQLLAFLEKTFQR